MFAPAPAAISTTEVVVLSKHQKALLIVIILVGRQPGMRRITLGEIFLVFFGWELVHIKIVLP